MILMINLKKQTREWQIPFNQSEPQTGWDVTLPPKNKQKTTTQKQNKNNINNNKNNNNKSKTKQLNKQTTTKKRKREKKKSGVKKARLTTVMGQHVVLTRHQQKSRSMMRHAVAH